MIGEWVKEYKSKMAGLGTELNIERPTSNIEVRRKKGIVCLTLGRTEFRVSSHADR
jgi:hypothetical protein